MRVCALLLFVACAFAGTAGPTTKNCAADNGKPDTSPTAFGYEASTLYYPKSPHRVFDPDQLECEDKVDGRARSPLHVAAKAKGDSPHNIRIMIVQLKNNVNARAFKCGGIGVTPLMAAAAKGNYKVVKELVDLGADLSLVDDHGNTAEKIAEYWMQEASDLERADRCGQIWQYLYEQRGGSYADNGLATAQMPTPAPRIKIFDATATQCQDDSPLHAAAMRDEDVTIYGMVVNLGYVVDRRGFKCGGSGVTPLMVAASRGSPNAARELLQRGADASLMDDHGNDVARIAGYWSGDGDQDRATRCQKVADMLREYAKAVTAAPVAAPTTAPPESDFADIHIKPVATNLPQNATDIGQVATAPDFDEASVSEVTVKTGKHGNALDQVL